MKATCAGMRILLAEGEPVTREVAMMLLQRAGLVVDLAGNGAEAVAMAGELSYAMILMDIQMPTLNGIDATLVLRRIPACRNIPIVAMKANAFAEDRTSCVEAGMNDFISNPFLPNDLFAMALKWLSRTKPCVARAMPRERLRRPRPPASVSSTTTPAVPATAMHAG